MKGHMEFGAQPGNAKFNSNFQMAPAPRLLTSGADHSGTPSSHIKNQTENKVRLLSELLPWRLLVLATFSDVPFSETHFGTP